MRPGSQVSFIGLVVNILSCKSDLIHQMPDNFLEHLNDMLFFHKGQEG